MDMNEIQNRMGEQILYEKGRREAVVGKSIPCLDGTDVVKVAIKMDMPGEITEEEFKLCMRKLGEAMVEVFRR